MLLSQQIETLRATSSTNAKLEFLRANAHDERLKLAFMCTLNPFLNYYIRVQPDGVFGESHLESETIARLVDDLNARRVTGNAARNLVESHLHTLTQPEAEVLCGIINRDLDCGVAAGTVNKVWKGLVPEYPCLLASPMTERIAEEIKSWSSIIAQTKYDGGRVNVIVGYDGCVELRSRNGKELSVHNTFQNVFSGYTGMVFDGEIVSFGTNGVLNRQTSNGIMNKAVRGTISKEEAETLVLYLWDMIPLQDFHASQSTQPYESRLARLQAIVDSIRLNQSTTRVRLAETRYYATLEECNEFYADMLSRGEEGVILKHPALMWSNTRSKQMVKLKQELRADLRVVGTLPHSKDSTLIGSLVVQSSCGMLITSVGSGLTDELRKQKPEYFLDKIVEIKYNSVIRSAGADVASLFLPVFIGIREDKDEANSFDEL